MSGDLYLYLFLFLILFTLPLLASWRPEVRPDQSKSRNASIGDETETKHSKQPPPDFHPDFPHSLIHQLIPSSPTLNKASRLLSIVCIHSMRMWNLSVTMWRLVTSWTLYKIDPKLTLPLNYIIVHLLLVLGLVAAAAGPWPFSWPEWLECECKCQDETAVLHSSVSTR